MTVTETVSIKTTGIWGPVGPRRRRNGGGVVRRPQHRVWAGARNLIFTDTASPLAFFPRLQLAAMKPQQCDQRGGQGATGAARSERRLQVRGRERYRVTRAAVGGAVGSGKAESRE